MAKGTCTFTDTSAEAKAGMLKQQYAALKAASSEALKIVRAKAPKRTDKRLMYNIQARTYTRTRYGFVVAHIGVLSKEKAKRVPYAGFYAHAKEFGTSEVRAEPFLKPGVYEAIPTIRAKLAEYLPNIENGNPNAPDEDETTNL